MITPIIMLALLIASCGVARLASLMFGREVIPVSFSAVLGITLVFCFTGVGHFIKTEPMSEMLPVWGPVIS